MTTATKKQTRYGKVLAHFETVQIELIGVLAIDSDQFKAIEFEYGMKLLEAYFHGCSHPELAMYYSRALSQNQKHMYWPWFMNQKRRKDEAYLQKYRHTTVKENSNFLIVMYDGMLSDWIECDELHDQLRAFISNSQSLFL